MVNWEELGRVITLLRSVNKISQKELAEKCKMSPSYLSQIECGRRFPSIDRIEAIASAFSMKTSRLIKLAEDKNLETLYRGIKNDEII